MTDIELEKINKCADLLDPLPPEVVRQLIAEIMRLKQWVADCQSGMYINCVYCGHQYGPAENTPVSKADMLKEHISVCPDHPMSRLLKILASGHLAWINQCGDVAYTREQIIDERLRCWLIDLKPQGKTWEDAHVPD